MPSVTPPLDVSTEELEALLESVREALGEAGYQKLKAAIHTLSYVTQLLETREATLESLRRLLCQARSEKTETVLEQAGLAPSSTPKRGVADTVGKKPAPGHGRNGASAYPGAQRIAVPHASLQRGDRCPECQRGKVYPLSEAGLLVRLHGQAPMAATIYELQKLRCNLCGEVFTAGAPAGVGEEKYEATTATMIALLRYGSGFPWNRLADLQASMGIPLPVATQCEIVAEAAATLQPAMEELIRQAAQGEVLHNDDTTMPILALRRKHVMTSEDEEDAAERTGVFTSGIVSTAQKRTIALFFTGRRHAGENLAQVLERRTAELAPPLQMCDALTRNLPKLPEKLEVIVGHCLVHARRRFVEVTPNFPEPCRHVLEQLGKIYSHDAQAREQALTPQERLRFHQRESGPVMGELRVWLNTQFVEKKVEPNSGLGTAIRYLLKHWERLTLFLRQPGAPLDNSIAERALKKAILHRKNSLFYKTENGARVGDLFMSLIHTCELSAANPFDYLTQLQQHADELVRDPSQWMPWNYQAALETTGARLDSG